MFIKDIDEEPIINATILLDAPPHLNKVNIFIIKTEIKKTQEKGITIISIVGSGAKKQLNI